MKDIDRSKESNLLCKTCKGTGEIRYQKIGYAMYSWQPWEIKKCSCKTSPSNENH